MTSQENLQSILESMPCDTMEIKHVVLKSQAGRRRKSLWTLRNRGGGGQKVA